ncbi:uncharacterized protein LOC100371105 [Saccoglossus kowalevskii]|uniref:Uncharacterized protein LOC100371105 n=1 Tax=Saccoglossus kowalevskii TaxID=10224 RepID=A0ABM0GP96_SACKO|nr:PREDICTED: uncharacterized protein LOC100371105 [Saccoglossus kowalevskii]
MGCGSSSSTKTEDGKKPGDKKGGVEKLDIKETKIEDVDKIFEDAAAPFNKAVEVKEAFDKALESFKVLTGHTAEDTIKVVMLDLKVKFPQLTLEIEEGPRFVLTTGSGEGAELADLALKVVDVFNAISDLVTKIIDLMKQSVESAQALIEKAPEITDMVKNANLSPFELPRALKNTVHNISEFKKVPQIGAVFKKTIEDVVEDVKETKKALQGQAA